MEKIKELYMKYKEIVNYLICGFLAMIVSFATYFLFAKVFRIDEVISNALSWGCAVTFAYFTNKIFVFESNTSRKKETIKEMIKFFLARVASGILCDVGTFALMVKVLDINDIFSKIVTQIMVIIVNYIMSKYLVFKSNKKENNSEIKMIEKK